MRRVVAAVAAAVVLAGCRAPAEPPSASASPQESESAPYAPYVPSVPATPPGPSVPPTPGPTTSAFAIDFPALDGSAGLAPLGSLLLQRLGGVPAEQADNVAFTTTPSAYETLACGDRTKSGAVVLAYQPAQSTLGVLADCAKLEYHPIGRDALVFVTNAANPVTSLTTRQYLEIYTGKITDWQEVGGTPGSIVAYQRTDSSASQALFRQAVLQKAKPAKAPSGWVKEGVGGPVKGLASYDNSPGALSYSTFHYASRLYAQAGVKLLGANGVQPSNQTIADGTYPYVAEFYAVVRADEPKNGPARRTVAWLESAVGQKTVVDAGYVGKE